MSGGFQRYSRRAPCPICGGNATEHPHCHGMLTGNGAFARCTRADGSDGAMLDEKCSPPAYVYRRQVDGSYRPWTDQPPVQPVRIMKPRKAADSAPQDATEKAASKTHPRMASRRTFIPTGTLRRGLRYASLP